MKITIYINETPRGDVELRVTSSGASTATRKETCYLMPIKDLLQRELPKIGKVLGGKGIIYATGEPANS
jgi:hypothetical protein